MKKKARKKLVKRVTRCCYFSIKLILLALIVAFFVIQFDSVRMLFVRGVVSETLKHCPTARPQQYEIFQP